MELKPKEPALAGLAPVRTVFAQQTHASVSEAMTDGQRLGINQIESWTPGWHLGRGPEQSADLRREGLQARHPLWVRTQVRKGRMVVVGHQTVSLFQAGHP